MIISIFVQFWEKRTELRESILEKVQMRKSLKMLHAYPKHLF